MKVFQKWIDRPKGANTQMDLTIGKDFLRGLQVNRTTVRFRQILFYLCWRILCRFETVTGICVLLTIKIVI
jgi:hypothetical protein